MNDGSDESLHKSLAGSNSEHQRAEENRLGFDRAWYLNAYPDVAASGQDPYQHWLNHGRSEGRHINGSFSFSPSELAVLSRDFHYEPEGVAAGQIGSHSPEYPQGLSDSMKEDVGFDSAQYWRTRYREGGTSGAGSYGRLAAFKAEIINRFVQEHGIGSVMEFGCGDGAQLTLAEYPSYVGFDVADESVDLCRVKFAKDPSKQFRNAAAWDYERADLTLSLDVIYHLIEDSVFHEYMRRLFFSAERYVIVYSSNQASGRPAAHVMHRKFTDWVDIYHADFKLIQHIPNRWPLVNDGTTQSFADFYIFERQPRVKNTLPGNLVVSLTSYPKRFPTLELTLRRILQQTVKPDETVLWVSQEAYDLLPEGVLALSHIGLTIRTTKDVRSYTKIIPALQAYPDSYIITLDDDTDYPLDVVEIFITNYQSDKEILCRRAHKILFDETGSPKPYTQWQFETSQETGTDLFATGVGGIFYPPHSLSAEVQNEATFTQLAPFADDVWLFWMAHRGGSSVRRVGPRYVVRTWPGCNEQGLFVTHNAAGGNDPVIAALTSHYGSPFQSDLHATTGVASFPSRVDTTVSTAQPISPQPRFRLLRRLLRPATRPLMRIVSSRFMPRGEAAAAISGLTAGLREVVESLAPIRQDLQGLSIRQGEADKGIEPIRRTAQELAAQLGLMRESLAAIERSLAQFQKDERSELDHIRQEERDQFAQIRHDEEELKYAVSDFRARVRELERTAAFDRQAIRDLGEGLVLSASRTRVLASPSVGVVVATCDRPGHLRAALESLAAQTRQPEVVVVVNDGKEGVEEVVGPFAGALNIVVLRTPSARSGSSLARNLGLDALRTPLVAFLDDDNLMWPYWLERASILFANDPALDAIYGAQLRDSDYSRTDKSWFLVPYDLDRLREANFIDLNQLVHRASDVRFDTQMRRLVDWDYVLKLIDRIPGEIAPVDAISSIYSAAVHDRISVPGWPPELREVAISRREGRRTYLPELGNACPCGYLGEFLPGPGGKRPKAGCPQCGSLERHRFLRLVAPLIRTIWMPASRPHETTSMMEVAPSPTTQPVRDMFGTTLTVDADPQADGRIVDVVASLTSLPMDSEAFDFALVLHVLEHIPDDRAAMREVARVLRSNGIAALQVPLSSAATTDEEVLASPEEREARYGQADHVRLYGQDFVSRLNEEGLTTVAISPRESMPQQAIDKYGLLPDEALVFAVRSDSSWAVTRLGELAAMLRKGAF